jgi:hypothetical protein
MARGIPKHNGDWMAARDTASSRENFWLRVVLHRANDCWRWNGSFIKDYGAMHLGGETVLAHRYSYFMERGELPAGLVVRHSCDNPGCVNPKHLIEGTHKDNSQDMVRRGRARGPQKTLTQRQIQMLDYLRDHISKHGCSPSYSEIGEAIDLQHSGVTHMLLRLQRHGLIHREKYARRGIQLTQQAAQ